MKISALSSQKKWIFRIIGIIIFIVIILRLDLSKVKTIVLNANSVYLFFAVILVPLVIFMKAWKWKFIMGKQNMHFSHKNSVLIYAAGLFVGAITPGRIGDFIKVVYLKNKGYPVGKSFFSVFFDRLFDILGLFCLGFISLLIFWNFFEKHIVFITVTLTSILLVSLFLIKTKHVSKKIILKLFSFLVPEKYKGSLEEHVANFYNDLHLLTPMTLLLILILTFLSWFIYFGSMYLLALSLNIGLDFITLSACVSLATIATLLPITVFGVGSRDVALLFLFQYLGLSKESAIAFSALILIVQLITGFFCLFAWLKKPVSINSNAPHVVK